MDITNPEQYYKQIQERFPELSLKQIDKICKYGLRSFAGHTMIGGDILLKAPYFTGYCGKLFMQHEIYRKYVYIKKCIKARIHYRRAKKIYDGRYYFGMMKKNYNKFYKPYKKKNNKGMHVEHMAAFKSYEECTIIPWDYVFEWYRPESKFKIWIEKGCISKFNLIAKKDKDGKLQPVGKGKEKSIWKRRA